MTVGRRHKIARGLIFLTSLFFFLLLAIAGADWILGQNRERIRRSERLDANLVRHDSDLGWVLTRDWRGEHRHHDFHARYSTDDRGFRAHGPQPSGWPGKHGKRYAVFGDSFTFGIGVNDDETFVGLLNRSAGPQNTFLNCGVPGYSTDQECLAIERQLPFLKADVIVLVVYLANDIFDNQLPVPLQVNGTKPFYKLESERLVLCNWPVSPNAGSALSEKPTLSSMVTGSRAKQGVFKRLAQQSDVLGILRERAPFKQDSLAEYRQRFSGGLDLFSAIVKRADGLARPLGAELKVVLLAGRSYIESPETVSAQYQEALRQDIVSRKMEKIALIDLASAMRELATKEKAGWYFPNDGHLTPAGHQVVAELLQNKLNIASHP